MANSRSFRLLVFANAVAIALVILGNDRSIILELFGWALLLPGSVVMAIVEGTVAPLIGSRGASLAFWNIADVAFLPCCVGLNVLVLWFARRSCVRLGSSQITEQPPHRTSRHRLFLFVVAGVVGLGACGAVFMTFFATDELVYRNEFRKGNDLIAKAEAFRRTHGRVPQPKELVIADEDSGRFLYIRCSDHQYIVGFGTTLGESMTYSSATGRWEGLNRVCGE